MASAASTDDRNSSDRNTPFHGRNFIWGVSSATLTSATHMDV
jgi:uncharacterized protein (UPF0147 family)